MNVCAKHTFCAFFWRANPTLSPDSQKGSMSPRASEPWVPAHRSETGGPSLYAEAPVELWRGPRECSSSSARPSRWGSAFSVPGEAVAIGRTLAFLLGGRRVVLCGAQRLKDAERTEAACAPCVRFPRIRASNSAAPPCSRQCPGPSFSPAWSPPPGLNHFTFWSLSPLHPCPVPLPTSDPASLPPSTPESLGILSDASPSF